MKKGSKHLQLTSLLGCSESIYFFYIVLSTHDAWLEGECAEWKWQGVCWLGRDGHNVYCNFTKIHKHQTLMPRFRSICDVDDDINETSLSWAVALLSCLFHHPAPSPPLQGIQYMRNEFAASIPSWARNTLLSRG